MRTLLLCAALLLAPASLALAATAAPCEAGTSVSCQDVKVGSCTYDASVAASVSFDVTQDCYSGITRCHTEVSGGLGQPINPQRWCAY
ncbi:MAG: hypothetical protein QOD77_530 [Thermoplasmata archaeon]|jgi:hypothetical protein|nr:hypothetical protein [Thermoplasmata archaeon]